MMFGILFFFKFELLTKCLLTLWSISQLAAVAWCDSKAYIKQMYSISAKCCPLINEFYISRRYCHVKSVMFWIRSYDRDTYRDMYIVDESCNDVQYGVWNVSPTWYLNCCNTEWCMGTYAVSAHNHIIFL